MIFCTNKLVAATALKCARGSYQRALIYGHQRASGSDIENRWGARYLRSRESLFGRVEDAGIELYERTVTGKKFIILAASAADADAVDDETLLTLWI